MHRRINFLPTILLVCLSILMYSCTPTGSNWPQFRGADNNMVAIGMDYPTEWNDSLNVLWSTNLTGAGWSSPIVFGGKIFVTSAVLEKAAPELAPNVQPTPPPPPPQGKQQGPPLPKAEDNSYTKEVYRWELTCYDLKSGKELWKQVARNGNPRAKKHAGSTYACETPVTDGKRIYA